MVENEANFFPPSGYTYSTTIPYNLANARRRFICVKKYCPSYINYFNVLSRFAPHEMLSSFSLIVDQWKFLPS